MVSVTVGPVGVAHRQVQCYFEVSYTVESVTVTSLNTLFTRGSRRHLRCGGSITRLINMFCPNRYWLLTQVSVLTKRFVGRSSKKILK